MQLSRPFIQLPLAIDADRLREEVERFAPGEWRAHPQGHPGNTALPLVARHGDPGDDGVAGRMAPTPYLARCPYLRQVLAALQAPLGRTRLMRLDAGAEATAHIDANYYWAQRVRVHVPVVTTPDVRFLCGDVETHMAAGEAWIFDTWQLHNVLNPANTQRIHLVADTVGSSAFWSMTRMPAPPMRKVAYAPGADPQVEFEAINFPIVMSPYEFEAIWNGWIGDARGARNVPMPIASFDAGVREVLQDWRAAWATHGADRAGWPAYEALLARLHAVAERHAGVVTLANGQDLGRHVQGSLIPSMFVPWLADDAPSAGERAAPREQRPEARTAATPAASVVSPPGTSAPTIRRPLIVLCAPRSGSTLLFERLWACSPDWFTVGNESHQQIEGIEALRPQSRGYDSNVLAAADAAPGVVADLTSRFLHAARDRDGRPPRAGTAAIRLLEKTPKNALRVPFLRAAFPDARFLYLWRDPAESLASMIEGWQSGGFVTYPDLPGWSGLKWSYLLVPGWRDLVGRPLAEIVAAQWRIAQERLLADMADIPADSIRTLGYGEFLQDPARALQAICEFADVAYDRPPPPVLPLSLHTLTPPAPEKWRRHEAVLGPLLPALEPVASRARAFVGARHLYAAPARQIPAAAPQEMRATTEISGPAAPKVDEAGAAAPDLASLSSMHTANFPGVLAFMNTSLFVTNYQGGNLIAIRPNGAAVNTHFEHYRKPMGLACARDRFFLGTESGIREFRNVPSVSPRLDPPNRHDAVFVFRKHHITGNIDIHEMALGADNELWFVNTLFSCLCTLDADSSFRPRWRPAFVTGLSPDDRCHLNGLAMVDGRPRWLTALGATDAPQGWRGNTKNGGVLIDYETREVVARGLSMPHSPRWYRDRLWFLESGRGSLATIDPASGKVETVARLPGFTRGLDFVGPLAFVGLSQLRESNPLTDIPITEENVDRMSGVWVVDIETGQTAAILKFGGGVQEIFAVQALPGILSPEIVDEDKELLQTIFALPDEAFREVRYEAKAQGA